MAVGSAKHRLVILDRDGVINRDSKEFVKNADEWIPIPGSIEAIAALSRAGFKVAVASNQSGLARGLFDEVALQSMHDKLTGLVAAAGGQVDRIAICPHGPDEDCACRKPRPGLILDLLQHFNVDAAETPFIGDSLRDLQAAAAAGVRPILVRTGNGDKAAAGLSGDLAAVAIFDDLQAAATSLLEGER